MGGSVGMKFQVQLPEVIRYGLFHDVLPPVHIRA